MRAIFPIVLSLLAAISLGCGGGTGTLTGFVEFKGRKLTQGTIQVVSDNGAFYASSRINPDGSYRIENCPTGTLKVAVISPNPEAVAAAASARASQQLKRGRANAPTPPPPPAGDPDTWFEIPEIYGRADESGLKVEVSSGENHQDIKIE